MFRYVRRRPDGYQGRLSHLTIGFHNKIRGRRRPADFGPLSRWMYLLLDSASSKTFREAATKAQASQTYATKEAGLSGREAIFMTCPLLNHSEDSASVFLDAVGFVNKLTGTFGQGLPLLCIAVR
jgi:hypothetical protein